MEFRTETNQECRKCHQPLDKFVSVRRGINVYICGDCGAIYKRNLGNSANPVGEETSDEELNKTHGRRF